MNFKELAILLPCHSLEDFPQHHEGDDAAGLLACWTALWHPALLAACGNPPRWYRLDDPPDELEGRLLLVPSVSAGDLPTGFAQRAQAAGACVIRREHDRAQILETALAQLDGGAAAIRDDLVADFLALGYGFLQIQLLTRQMRYSSNLDEVHFHDQLLQGAQAAASGDEQLARQKLTACFDLLAEERDHYYSVDAYLIDLTLLAPQTLGAGLQAELEQGGVTNLLADGRLLEALAEQQPDSWRALRAALEAGRVGLVGGSQTDARLPLLSLESILADLRRGAATCQRLLSRGVEVFGRRRFGLTPVLPQLLHKLGFRGALHATLDDGRFPQGTQAKTRWEGVDGSAIDALAKVPLDAAKSETFLGLAHKLGESMDMDHVATITLAHWPGHSSPWYEDLRRCAKYGSALGKFVTVDEYFGETYMPGQLDRFDADAYSSPYLKQSVIRRQSDPLSACMRYWRRRALVDAAGTLGSLAGLVSGDLWVEELEELCAQIDGCAESGGDGELDERLGKAVERASSQLADGLPRRDAAAQPGYLVVNPFSFAHRVTVDVSRLERLPRVAKPIFAVGESGEARRAVIDLPPLGFVWVTAGGPPPRPRRAPPPLAEDRSAREGVLLLRNDFFEVLINATTGSLQSLKDYESRGNRISQQLAIRLPGPRPRPGEAWRDADETAVYSVMAADAATATSDAAVGEVTVRGRLLDQQGETLANFQQTYRVCRGSRVLQLEVELEPLHELAADPWNSYYACRFAWADETAELTRGCQQTRHALGRKRFEATDYVDIDAAPLRTTILTGGLPFHRRVGARMLDSLLIVRGEGERRFRLGIGVDLANPAQDALALLLPPIARYQQAPPPAPADSGWLFHIDAKQVLATFWAPLIEEGRVVGFRARLLETAGRPARARLSSFREVASARQVDFVGQSLGEARVEDGRINLEMTAHEWLEIEARF